MKNVTVIDDAFVEPEDKHTNWFFKEEYINKRRGQAYLPDLQALNNYTSVNYQPPSYLDEKSISSVTSVNEDVIILCGEYDLERIKAINARARSKRAGFILANALGMMGHLFIDHVELKIHDKYYSGLNNTFYINGISNEKAGKVTLSKVRPLFLQSGDFVAITDVEGMTEVNDAEARPIKVIDPFTFTIENTTKFGKYIKGGVVTYIPISTKVTFNSFEQNIQEPIFAMGNSGDYSQLDMHIANIIYCELLRKRKYDPSFSDFSKIDKKLDTVVLDIVGQSEALTNIYQTQNVENYRVMGALRQMISNEKFTQTAVAKLIAGLAAFEIIPKVGKFNPFRQHLYFNFNEDYPYDLTLAYMANPVTPLTQYFDKFGEYAKNIVDHSKLR